MLLSTYIQSLTKLSVKCSLTQTALEVAKCRFEARCVSCGHCQIQVNKHVATMLKTSRGGCILVEGDAGMGKSRLMEAIGSSTFGGQRHALTILTSAANFDLRSQACLTTP